jgi:hypothetical protein
MTMSDWADSQEEEEEMVLNALTSAFEWVGPMTACDVREDDPRLPRDGRAMIPALRRLYKKGLVARSKTRHYGKYLWGLPGKWIKLTSHPGYFTHDDVMIEIKKTRK